MIGELGRFLVFNLGASLAAGALVAGGVVAISRVLGIRDARSRSWLLGAALVKSTLVLLGLASVVPLLAPAQGGLSTGAVPISTVAPWALVWVGVVLILKAGGVARLDRDPQTEDPQGPETARLRTSVSRIVARARSLQSIEGACYRCAVPTNFPEPDARVTRDRGPLTVDPTGAPIIEVPRRLVASLDDAELEAVIAHEVGHLIVTRDRGGCVPLWARLARWTSPSALILGSLLDREEELACDDLAVALTGQPTALANALLEAYRGRRVTLSPLAPVAWLLDGAGLFKQRVERLASSRVENEASSAGARLWIACAATVLLAAVV